VYYEYVANPESLTGIITPARVADIDCEKSESSRVTLSWQSLFKFSIPEELCRFKHFGNPVSESESIESLVKKMEEILPPVQINRI
jgi:hypothetical protein